MGTLELRDDLLAKASGLAYSRTTHDEWVARLKLQGTVILAGGTNPNSTRSKINGALRTRGLKARVLRATEGDNTVFVVTLR